MDNKTISKLLKLTSQLIDLHGGNPFRSKSYMAAAVRIGKMDLPVFDITEKEALSIEGIGKGVYQAIQEIKANGAPADLPGLLEKTPEGIIRLLSIKGLGPKKVGAIWKELEIETPGELLYACYENRLVTLKGFGAKTQEEVKRLIEFSENNQGRFLFPYAWPIASELEAILNTHGETVITGEVRRKCEIVESIDLICEADAESISKLLISSGLIHPESLEQNNELIKANCLAGIPVRVYSADKASKAETLIRTTGSEQHLNELLSRGPLRGDTELNIYKSLGLPYIEPELREDIFTLDELRSINQEGLVTLEDIKGMLHFHTTYSDGTNTLSEMAEYCIGEGFEYIGVADHSKSAFYAGGMNEDQVSRQHEEIDKLNKKLGRFRIFKGIESDILSDGRLDYEDDTLKRFDFVIASIHSQFRMDEDKATRRLIRAIENPYTTILGHMTGRLLLSRKGYPVDHMKVIDACAANNVVIELNANPHRLDIDYRWIHHCMNKDVRISINPDAHQRLGVQDIQYGVNMARKGGLTKDYCFNALSLADFEAAIKK